MMMDVSIVLFTSSARWDFLKRILERSCCYATHFVAEDERENGDYC